MFGVAFSTEAFMAAGASPQRAEALAAAFQAAAQAAADGAAPAIYGGSPAHWTPAARCMASTWQSLSRPHDGSPAPLRPDDPFTVHLAAFAHAFADWPSKCGPPPAWMPSEQEGAKTNLAAWMRDLTADNYDALHQWSCQHRAEFWQHAVRALRIPFRRSSSAVLDLSDGIESPHWFPNAQLNIAEACFQGESDRPAIVERNEVGEERHWTIAALEARARQVADGLRRAGLRPGDAVGIMTPMTGESVAAYLGMILAGIAVVSVADSFAPPEIETRLNIARARAVITQDVLIRGDRRLPLYEKLLSFDAPPAIVLPAVSSTLDCNLRPQDTAWHRFLGRVSAEVHVAGPDETTNVLFSSGTTGEPKAIPWNHTTPVKCAADALLHQDVQPGEVLAWPTNLGWMMGPWLIYAALVNRASMALYDGAPTSREFCTFVQETGVSMLGVVPSLVRAWRQNKALEGVDWSRIRRFSSTGECSNHEEMLFLMASSGYRPVIEYCGGTEIGGGYITSTMVQPNAPATFTTPAMGLDLVLADDRGRLCDRGEVYLIPPSIGLSTRLLNRNHHEVYYEGTPENDENGPLRRHGDELERLPGGYYRAHGRTDDTMNLGGIKVSSAEIERCLDGVDGVKETAAVAVTPDGGGPSELVVFAVLDNAASTEEQELAADMQQRLRTTLNPLFKVASCRVIERLPRTASNKVMRRLLRDRLDHTS